MRIYQVGGVVRDTLLGQPAKDIDWVVVGGTPEQMLALGYRPVGDNFPVFLHPDTGEEYALARTERKTGHGYGGFTFHAEPSVTLEDDLLRRDLTINAMARAPDGTLIDPYGGERDLQARILRHVSPAFAEDPLRVLRVARFAARYAAQGFTIAEETLALMRVLSGSGELSQLTVERVWQEFARALMEPSPEVFIQVLRAVGALAVLLPEVDRLFGVPQPIAHHPEVDTGKHTLLVLQQCAQHRHNLTVRWACLLHDVGKGLTDATQWPRHIGHETLGAHAINTINQRLHVPKEHAAVALLVGELHSHCHRSLEMRSGSLFRLLTRLDVIRRPQRLEDFLNACEMDAKGRLGFAERSYYPAQYLRDAARVMRDLSVQPLLAEGLTGAELGRALARQRLCALTQFKKSYEPERSQPKA